MELADKQALSWFSGRFPTRGAFRPSGLYKQRWQQRSIESGMQRFGVRWRTSLYNRWKVEAFHKSLKSNAGLAKSPTRTVMTQNNPIFMSIYAVFKLECLKIKHKTNHFALRTKLFIKANQLAYEELQKLRTA